MTMFGKSKSFSSPATSLWKFFEIPSTLSKRNHRVAVVHAMDFILTMIGCIVLNIDHRTNARRFEKIFTPESLEAIRNDLENLLRFERPLVDSVLLAWIKIRYSKEIANDAGLTIDRSCRGFSCKNDLRIGVLRVVNSMIFRRGANTIFRSNNEDHRHLFSNSISRRMTGRSITDFSCFVEYPIKVRIIALAEPRRKSVSLLNSETIDKKDRRRSCEFLEDINTSEGISTKQLLDFQECVPERKNKIDILADQSISVSEDRVVTDHICKKFDCPLCYGWLWLPICYCIYTFVRVIVDAIRGLFNVILGYFGETRVRAIEDA